MGLGGADIANRLTIVGLASKPVYTGSGDITADAISGGMIYPINRTVATTFYLPADPIYGQIVIVQDAGNNFDTYAVTVDGNGYDINVPNAGAQSSVEVGGNGANLGFNFLGTAWGVLL